MGVQLWYFISELEVEMSVDPVCKMEVDEKSAAATYQYQGKTYYFCSPDCKSAFEKEPQKYLQNNAMSH